MEVTGRTVHTHSGHKSPFNMSDTETDGLSHACEVRFAYIYRDLGALVAVW